MPAATQIAAGIGVFLPLGSAFASAQSFRLYRFCVPRIHLGSISRIVAFRGQMAAGKRSYVEFAEFVRKQAGEISRLKPRIAKSLE